MRGGDKRPLNKRDGAKGYKALTAVPNLPGDIPAGVRQKFNKYANILLEAGRLVNSDVDLLLTYCRELDLYERLMSEVEGEELVYISANGNHAPNGKIKLAKESLNHIRTLSNYFLFNPSARIKNNISSGAVIKKEDPAARFLDIPR